VPSSLQRRQRTECQNMIMRQRNLVVGCKARTVLHALLLTAGFNVRISIESKG
jgi:hypothetical protein